LSKTQRKNYKDSHRNKPKNYFLGLLTIMGVLLILPTLVTMMAVLLILSTKNSQIIMGGLLKLSIISINRIDTVKIVG
jgi:UPF0716 family protein affecting phage T7 exclusion